MPPNAAEVSSATGSIENTDINTETECDLLCSQPQPPAHPAYQRLPPGCIRLVKILPKDKGTISCEVQHFERREAPSFTALSYAWGSESPDRGITVNGHKFAIPKNLWRFLHQARDLPNGLVSWLWIDMLSINQTDNLERMHQVNIMSKIYSAATRVLVWLGPAYNDSDAAMAALARPIGRWQNHKKFAQTWASPAGRGIEGLCRRYYWRRLWVFQELRYARSKLLMCGSKHVKWERFEAFMLYVDNMQPQVPIHILDTVDVTKITPAMRMVHLNLATLDTTLWGLIQATSHLRCAQVLDKVYALLGVATDDHSFVADYTMPIPTLLNMILPRTLQPTDSTPQSLEDAASHCYAVEDIFGVKRGTIFTLHGQRGLYEAASERSMRACPLGGSGLNLWWTAFYGHYSFEKCLFRSFERELSMAEGGFIVLESEAADLQAVQTLMAFRRMNTVSLGATVYDIFWAVASGNLGLAELLLGDIHCVKGSVDISSCKDVFTALRLVFTTYRSRIHLMEGPYPSEITETSSGSMRWRIRCLSWSVLSALLLLTVEHLGRSLPIFSQRLLPSAELQGQDEAVPTALAACDYEAVSLDGTADWTALFRIKHGRREGRNNLSGLKGHRGSGPKATVEVLLGINRRDFRDLTLAIVWGL